MDHQRTLVALLVLIDVAIFNVVLICYTRLWIWEALQGHLRRIFLNFPKLFFPFHFSFLLILFCFLLIFLLLVLFLLNSFVQISFEGLVPKLLFSLYFYIYNSVIAELSSICQQWKSNQLLTDEKHQNIYQSLVRIIL